MVAERVQEWTQQWKEEGLREGLQQGRAEERRRALAEERALLLRLARRRFEDACAQYLAPLLEGQEAAEVLGDIGEWLVTCDSGAALLARVQALTPRA
jgi:hypothetical protein